MLQDFTNPAKINQQEMYNGSLFETTNLTFQMNQWTPWKLLRSQLKQPRTNHKQLTPITINRKLPTALILLEHQLERGLCPIARKILSHLATLPIT